MRRTILMEPELLRDAALALKVAAALNLVYNTGKFSKMPQTVTVSYCT
jgi:hypothetical protein